MPLCIQATRIEASRSCSETPEHRDGNYRRSEPRLGAVARLVRIAGRALSGLIGSLLRLRANIRQDIRLVAHAPQSEDFIVEP